MKDVVVYSNQRPSVDDVMALVHKLSFLDLLALSAAVGGDADKIANAAQEWDDQIEEERNKAREAAIMGQPAPYSAVPPMPAPVAFAGTRP